MTALFLLSLPAVTTRIYASDEVEGFAWLHSLAFDRDVSFENEYRYFYDSGQVKNPSFHETFLEDRWTAAGLRPNFTTMGAAILWAPFYGAAHLVARMTGMPADGLSQPYITAVAIGSATYGFLSLLLAIAIARRLTGNGLAAALAVWFGTPLLFYMYVTPIFTHACSAFAVALFLWIWVRVREDWPASGMFALGLAAGLMAIVRAQDALFRAGPAIDYARHAFRPRAGGARPEENGAETGHRIGEERRLPGRWAAGLGPVLLAGIGLALALAPQLLAFKALNGQYRQSEFETRKMTWSSPHMLEVLFDQQHGFFFWTPLAVVAMAGLVWLAWQGRTAGPRSPATVRWMAGLALVMFALQAYIAGAVESWTVAGAFGQRRFVSVTPLMVIGLAALPAAAAGARTRMRRALAALVVLCVWWNLGLIAQFGLHTMDRERLTLADNAWQSFVVLPARAPVLAWQYLTDRASFYNRPQQ